MASINYFASKVSQRDSDAPSLLVFTAHAKEILQWAGIRRVGQHEAGVQRILKKSRVRSIKRFLESDRSNTIPTSVVLAFEPGSASFESIQTEIDECVSDVDTRNSIEESLEWGKLKIDFDKEAAEHERPALIVDGQHRLQGMAALEEEVPVLVVALLDASREEQAFQFIVINNKSSRVSTDNVKGIIADIDEIRLRDRLQVARVNYKDVPATLLDIDERDDSPFQYLIDWPLNQDKKEETNILVKPTTIDKSLRYIRDSIPDLRNDEDSDSLKEILISIFSGVKKAHPNLWRQNSKFMSKVNLNSMCEYVVDRIEYAFMDGNIDPFDPESVVAYSYDVTKSIPSEFWEAHWPVKLHDSSAVRNQITSDLRQISKNVRSAGSDVDWYDMLNLISDMGGP